MKTRWKILLIIVIFAALSCAVTFVTMHAQPENEVEAYKKLLIAKGEKLEISEVLPPPVPPESNSVTAVEDAFRMFSSGSEKIPYAMKMVAPGKALIGWLQPDARNSDFTNSWEDFTAEVAVNRPAIELLHQVLERPQLDFHLDYKKGFTTLLPHLPLLKRSAQKLSAAVTADLHNGDLDSATTNLCVLLGLVQADQNEGLIISHLVRIAMASIATVATWDYLQATNVTDNQLATLQKSWRGQEFFHDAANSFLLERAVMLMTIEKMRVSHAEFNSVLGSGSSGSTAWSWPPDFDEVLKSARNTTGEAMWRTSWSFSQELYLLKGHQTVIETLRTMQTNQFIKLDYDALLARLDSLGITNTGEALFHALNIPNFREDFDIEYSSVVVLKTMWIEAARRIVIIAITLKRFQLKHGHLPEMLGELTPEFLPSIPLDPFDGKPLRYHPNADGTFMLYSVGYDGLDDGGDASPAKTTTSSTWYWQHGRDWVWPQPATAAEVENYYFEEAAKAAAKASAELFENLVPPPPAGTN